MKNGLKWLVIIGMVLCFMSGCMKAENTEVPTQESVSATNAREVTLETVHPVETEEPVSQPVQTETEALQEETQADSSQMSAEQAAPAAQILQPPVQTEETVKEPDENVITVYTADELIAAIGSDRKIILGSPHIDLSEASGYGTDATDLYYWEETFDGYGLVICNVNNLTVCGSGDDPAAHVISAVPRYANVLTFSRCSNILIQGFTAGHTVEPGYCVGGVIRTRYSDDVQIKNCALYGCGTLGVDASDCKNVSVSDCLIYECSYGGIRMWGVDGLDISGCTFRDLGGQAIQITECTNAVLNGQKIPGAYYASAY